MTTAITRTNTTAALLLALLLAAAPGLHAQTGRESPENEAIFDAAEALEEMQTALDNANAPPPPAPAPAPEPGAGETGAGDTGNADGGDEPAGDADGEPAPDDGEQTGDADGETGDANPDGEPADEDGYADGDDAGYSDAGYADAEPPGEEPANEEKTPTGILGYFDDPRHKTSHLKGHRWLDIGLLNANIALTNNLLGVSDILSKTLTIDFSKYASRLPDSGWAIGFDFDLKKLVEVNLNIGTGGGGFSAGAYGGVTLTIPKKLFTFLGEGNEYARDLSDSFTILGAVYAEAAFDLHIPFPVKIAGKPLRVGLAPAYFVPVLYIPKASLDYTMDTNDKILIDANGEFTAYSAVDINNPTDFDPANLSGGVDLTLYAEYPVFTRLDAGIVATHIPIVPAAMDHGMTGRLATSDGKPILEVVNVVDEAGSLDVNTPEFEFGDYRSLPAIQVMRPLRLDFYALFRPLYNDLLVLKPSLGFTVPIGAEKASDAAFNGSIEAQLHLASIFGLYVNTGAEDGVWRHRLGLDLNLRIFELTLEAALRSQDFFASFQARGIDITLGLHFGL